MSTTTQIGAVQSRKNCTETAQKKVGKTHVDYWAARLEKRTFLQKGGARVEIPDYQVRIQHLGRVAYFNLKTANATEAALKAREIYVHLIAYGWDATLAKYKQKPAQNCEGLTIDEFVDFYRDARDTVEYPPIKRTAERYISSLRLICRWVAVKHIFGLTTPKIKEFKGEYLKRGRAEKRDENSIKITCNAHVRSAAAIFSKQMMEAYSTLGLSVENPFTGVTIRRVEIKPYTPMDRDLLNLIWENSITLRDGDPDFKGDDQKSVPNQLSISGKLKGIRWVPPDWRQPHPEAFMILLLELGLGLRRGEADWAQWDWFFLDAKGRRYIEIRQTPYFTPKGKRRRIIPVEPVLWDIIHEWYEEGDIFVVPGNLPKMRTSETESKSIYYRCERHHRTLVAWLRMKGIKDDNPCHLLRKEFGSYVATSFGLFAAQRLLGHSSVAVTEGFYAGLTNLPELSHVKVPVHQAA